MDVNAHTNAIRPRGTGAVSASGRPAPGDTVQARITGSAGNGRYTAVVRGATVTVASRESLAAGSTVVLTVDDASDRIFARLLASGGTTPGKEGLAAVLKGMGVTAGKQELAAAARLLQLDIPFNASLVNRVADALALPFASGNSGFLDTVLFAALRGIPLQEGVLMLLHRALSGGDAAGKALQSLFLGLRRGKGGGHGTDDDEKGGPDPYTLPDPADEGFIDALKRFAGHGGSGGHSGNDGEAGRGYDGTMLRLLRELAALQTREGGDESVSAKVRELLTHYHGIELANAALGEEGIYLSLPVRHNGQTRTARVYVERPATDTNAPARLRFRITTARLGEVTADVTLGDAMADCVLTAADDDAGAILDTHREELADGLRQALGGLAAVRCRTEQADTDPLMDRMLAPERDRRLDTRA